MILCRDIGERLRASRKSLGWSQAKLSEKSGVSETTICNLEKGKQGGSAFNVACIACAMGASMDYLCGLTDHQDGRRR